MRRRQGALDGLVHGLLREGEGQGRDVAGVCAGAGCSSRGMEARYCSTSGSSSSSSTAPVRQMVYSAGFEYACAQRTSVSGAEHMRLQNSPGQMVYSAWVEFACEQQERLRRAGHMQFRTPLPSAVWPMRVI